MTTQDLKSTRMMLIAMLLAAGSVTGLAKASPEGGDVVEGEADIDYGDWTRVVTGEITIIEWLSFNIAAGETVEFIMPSEASRVLNLINSGVPTEIMGNLIGNGQIFLVNPSGVIFGQGSVVNVGALYAAAGNISGSDFVNGVYRFTDARGVVENRGLLRGDLIALVGGRVANYGTISAPGGTVIMAAGEQVLIGEHLGHLFVELEKPSDLANTDPLSGPDGTGLAAGDVFSLAAWNTGTIEAEHTTIAVSAGTMALESDMDAGDITLIAQGDSRIELGADLSASGEGVFVDGDLLLSDDVGISLSGEHGTVAFGGSVDSAAGEENDLVIDAGDGVVSFMGDVGRGAGDSRLGVLDVSALRVEISGDVAVNQEMNFYAPVAIMGDSTAFDVGYGSALFAGNLYSGVDGASDVVFDYDGSAWVGTGEARTPFKFRGSIGVGPALSTSASGAFGNIRFGGDLADPSRVSAFMFGSGAVSGLDLMNQGDVDLGRLFQVVARESIVMGQGQKMLSFGSLALRAKGAGTTLVEVGDLNVLGDLSIASQGREGGFIHILDRAPSEVDYAGNEANRDLDGLMDLGTELIASGAITLDGELVFSGPVLLGASQVYLYNNTGAGDGAGLDIGVFPGGVTLDLFGGVLAGTGDLLYPYDLAFPASVDPNNPLAQLATAFSNERDPSFRTVDPLLAERRVLQELTLNPRDPDAETIRESLGEQAPRYDENGAAEFGVTIDRLTHSSVQRLTRAYIDLFGTRRSDESVLRDNDEQITQTLGWLWLQTNQKQVGSIQAYARQADPEAAMTLARIQRVLDAIELLELTPSEIARARSALLARIKPRAVPMGVLEGWFPLDAEADALVVRR